MVNPRAIDLIVEEQPLLAKRGKLQESMMEGNIKLSYPECTYFCHIVENCIKMLYQTVIPIDAAELKKLLEDHLC